MTTPNHSTDARQHQQHPSPDRAHGELHPESLRLYTIIFVWLIVLMFATIIAALLDLGAFNLAVALTIAVIKATLVVLFFMHVKDSGRLIWIYSAGAFLWLGILLVLTFSDYLSRGWVPRRLPSIPFVDVRGVERAPAAGAAPFPVPRTWPRPQPGISELAEPHPPERARGTLIAPGTQPAGLD